ncbi:MAG: LTA synthase family protein, partial [Clostridia bacterium]|nr:LTA synthase family protein [Clostridia bacterium]
MQRIKKFFTNFKDYFKEIINDNGNFSLARSLILLVILSLFTVVYQMIVQNSSIFQLYLPVLLFNAIPVFLTMCLLYFIIGKISCSFVITNVILSLMLLVNHFKIRFRDEPLNASDFSVAAEAKGIIKNYNISFDFTVAVILIICTVAFWAAIKYIKNKRPGFIISVTGIVLTVAASFASYNLIYKNSRIYNSLLSSLQLYHETEIVSSKGLVYSILNSTSVMIYKMPEKYSKEYAMEILNRYPRFKVSKSTPNVIAVMGEAFADIQGWKNVEFIDENPYDFFNSLKEKNSCYGKIFVAGFGGATSCTEFEFLTGENTSAISPALPTAYKTLITKDTYSLARTFKESGFETVAMHPGYPWFYNRQNAYPRMGFDKFISREDLPDDIPVTGTYANDTVVYDMITEDFSRHLEDKNHGGYFNFTVTIQNHGSYKNNRLVYNKEYIAKTKDMTDEEYYIINNYLGGIKAADDLLKSIYEYINSIDEPTVMIFFGDHLPYLDPDEMLFKKLG